MEHHLDFLNPADAVIHEDDIVEIDETLEWANEERLKKQNLERKISAATEKLNFLVDLFSHTDNFFAKSKINDIIKTLN